MSSPAATRRRTLRYERVGVRASGGPKPNPNPASECGRAARDAPDETIAGRRVLWRADILEDTASDEAFKDEHVAHTSCSPGRGTPPPRPLRTHTAGRAPPRPYALPSPHGRPSGSGSGDLRPALYAGAATAPRPARRLSRGAAMSLGSWRRGVDAGAGRPSALAVVGGGRGESARVAAPLASAVQRPAGRGAGGEARR